MAAVGTEQVRYHEKNCEKYKKCYSFSYKVKNYKVKNLKVKNYNLNVTEVRDSDFKNAFPGIFNFTVGILFTIQSRYFEGKT